MKFQHSINLLFFNELGYLVFLQPLRNNNYIIRKEEDGTSTIMRKEEFRKKGFYL